MRRGFVEVLRCGKTEHEIEVSVRCCEDGEREHDCHQKSCHLDFVLSSLLLLFCIFEILLRYNILKQRYKEIVF